MLHMANDSGLFRTREQLEADGWTLDGNMFRRGDRTYLPLYEAKMVHHFDHRFGTYEGQTDSQANQGKLPEFDEAQHADPHRVSLPWYWVPAEEVAGRLDGRWKRHWLLGWRDICRNTDTRTVIASVLPRAGVGHTFPLALPALDDHGTGRLPLRQPRLVRPRLPRPAEDRWHASHVRPTQAVSGHSLPTPTTSPAPWFATEIRSILASVARSSN